MDKVTFYKVIAEEVLREVAGDKLVSSDGTKTHLILDDKRGHYLLFSDGWRGKNVFMDVTCIFK